MQNPEIQLRVAEELKEMRKGSGVHGFNLNNQSLLGAAYDRQSSSLMTDLHVELNKMGEQGAALANALAVGFREEEPTNLPVLTEPLADDLMSRRRAYAQLANVSERTLSRHEDAAIDKLAQRLTRRFRTAPYIGRVKRWATEFGDFPVGGSTSSADTSDWPADGVPDELAIPDDLPSLVQLQAKAIDELLTVVARLSGDLATVSKQLVAIRAANAKVAKTWGIQLD